MTVPPLLESIGLLGAFLYLTSFAILQWYRNFAKSPYYYLMNVAASLAVLISLMDYWNLACFVINSMWLVISSYGIYRCVTPGAQRSVSETQAHSR